MRLVLGAAIGALVLGAGAVGQVSVTVGPGSEDYRTIQEGVDAVEPGGSVRISPGLYDGFVVSKAVRVLGSRDPDPRLSSLVLGPVIVDRVEGLGCVVLVDFRTSDGEIQILNCTAPIVISHCGFSGGAIVQHSTNVSFVDSGINSAFSSAPRFALTCTGSQVLLQDSGVFSGMSLGAAMCVDSSEVISWRGGIGSVPASLLPAGFLRNHSRVLWIDGLYGLCSRAPCVPFFDADDTSEAEILRAATTELRVLQSSSSLQLEVSIPPVNSYSILAFSNPTGPTPVGQGVSWLDPGSTQVLGANFTSLGTSFVLDYPLVELPERLGIPFFVQAGIVEMDGRVTLSSPGVVVF